MIYDKISRDIVINSTINFKLMHPHIGRNRIARKALRKHFDTVLLQMKWHMCIQMLSHANLKPTKNNNTNKAIASATATAIAATIERSHWKASVRRAEKSSQHSTQSKWMALRPWFERAHNQHALRFLNTHFAMSTFRFDNKLIHKST